MSTTDLDKKLETKSPSTVGAVKGACTALEAGAPATYGSTPRTGKRFSGPPDNTGDNRPVGVPVGVGTPNDGASGQPPNGDVVAWSWPYGRGEVRLVVAYFKGRHYLNVRWWADKPHGMVPTREGVMIPLEGAEDFASAAVAAAALLRSRAA
jgi:hypothetical protein